MKRVKYTWIGLSMIVVMAMALAVASACGEDAEDAEEPETRGTLYLVDQDWNGQLVTTAVAQILLEKEMGPHRRDQVRARRLGPPLHRSPKGRLPFRLLQLAFLQCRPPQGIRGRRRRRQGGAHGTGGHHR